MKKIFSFLTIALIAICAFSFASCSSDDDDEKFSTSDVVGTWVTTSIQTSDGTWVDLTKPLYASQRAYANFKSDGTYIGWGSLGNGTGTWKLKGNTLTTYVDGEVYITYKNITLNGNDMSGTMSQGSTSLNFKAKKQ